MRPSIPRRSRSGFTNGPRRCPSLPTPQEAKKQPTLKGRLRQTEPRKQRPEEAPSRAIPPPFAHAEGLQKQTRTQHGRMRHGPRWSWPPIRSLCPLSICKKITSFDHCVLSTGLCMSLSLALLRIYGSVPHSACSHKTKFLKMQCLKFKGNQWSLYGLFAIRGSRVQISTLLVRRLNSVLG